MKIRMIKDYISDQFIGKNEILEVRPTIKNFFNIPYQYQVISGEHSGIKIPYELSVELPEEPTYSLAEYTAVHQELLQRREEVNDLMYKLDAAQGGRKRAECAADRLEKEIQEGREAKKVSLPREVVEAVKEIRYSNDGLTDYAILRIFVESILYKSAREALNEKYPEDSYTRLMEALVNGYTVEQAPWEKFQHGVRELLEEYGKTPRGRSPIGFAKKIDELYESIFGKKASG